MGLPAGTATRAATWDDVAACCALVRAVDVEEYGAPDYEEADVREEWSRERFDLARDTWLVHDHDRLVGYAATWDKRPASLVIGDAYAAPDGPDLYPWLVGRVSDRAEEHARASGRTVAHVYTSEPNARRAAALRAAGYEPVRVFRRMEAPLDGDLPEPRTDAAIRRVAPDDLRICFAILRDAFGEHFDHADESYEGWHARLVATGSYRPEYWWLAEVGGAPAGVLVGQRHEGDGFVRSVGVLAFARGRGVGTALLLTAFRAFRADGAPRVGLNVDSANVTGAMALYERIGMRAVRRYDCYERVFTST